MFDSIYVGLTGLLGFSSDLTIIGNNVANLNTPGFKGSNLQFADLFYRSQFSDNNTPGANTQLDIGSGVGTNGTRTVFSQGQLKQTGNDQDVAITGNGFFILNKDGSIFYTRDGQFSFDANGFLVSQAGARVQALSGGQLHDININGLRTNPGQATTKVTFTGTLDSGTSISAPYDVTGITVYDSTGLSHTLSMQLTNNYTVQGGSWLVDVKDENGNVLTSGEVHFNTDGNPEVAFNSVDVSLSPGSPQTISFYFGDPGSTSGVRSIGSTTNNVQASSQDGFGVGSLTKATFDATGTLVLTYSNGQTSNYGQLGLASFNFLQGLHPQGNNAFVPGPDGEQPLLGTAGTGAFGSISGGQIELANVDLAQQFSDLIISQRGYQASSQVISTANDMIQSLYDIKAKR
jgi:flagellar hook protein FlgE